MSWAHHTAAKIAVKHQWQMPKNARKTTAKVFARATHQDYSSAISQQQVQVQVSAAKTLSSATMKNLMKTILGLEKEDITTTSGEGL